jgi:hypothetical protein
MMAKADTVRP